jgi:hypothetical protein
VANKRSVDLARYVEAQFGGMTPGQQSASLSMVTPRDIKDAKKRAEELRLVHPPRDPLALAMVVKAAELALALGCERRDAWLLLQKEREGLMPYIHQKRAPAAPEKVDGDRILAFMVPEGAESPGVEFVDDFDQDAVEVLQPKSHDAI